MVLEVLADLEVLAVLVVLVVQEVLEGLEVVLGVLEGQLYQETIWTAPAQCLSLTCRHSPLHPGGWQEVGLQGDQQVNLDGANDEIILDHVGTLVGENICSVFVATDTDTMG